MISKSLLSHECHALARVLMTHLSMFDFIKGDKETSLPRSRAHYRIDTESAHPVRQKPYCVSSTERAVIAEQVTDMLRKGVVQESSNPWAAPVILVRKKDGSWRFCVDYRKLNTVTKKDVYPLPRIDDVIDCLHSAAYFSSLDLRSGYWQIRMHPNDKEKTAFVTPDGPYEFNVMPFGLCNAPATLERFMDTIIRGLTVFTRFYCALDCNAHPFFLAGPHDHTTRKNDSFRERLPFKYEVRAKLVPI